MEHFNKPFKVLIAAIIMLTCLFSVGIAAYAATDVHRFAKNEVSDQQAASFRLHPENLENYDTQHGIYGSVSGWEEDVILFLMSEDVIRPIEHNGKYFMPSENYITRQDALGITLFFHWSEYKGTQSERKSVFASAGTLMEAKTGNSAFKQMDMASTLTRKEAALILASCVEIKSGGEYSLSDYHSSMIGRRSDGTVVDHYNNYSIDGDKILDLEYVHANVEPDFIQAYNLLIDFGVCNGREASGGVNLAPDDTIMYNEYYSWLVQVGMGDTGGGVEDPVYVEAALEMFGNSVRLNYRTFLDDLVSAEISVYMDASNTSGNPEADSFSYWISDEYDTEYDDETSRDSTYFDFSYSATDVKFTEKKAKANKGDYTIDIAYDGTVNASNGEADGEASASTTVSIIIYNDAPRAKFAATTDRLADKYAPYFFYATEPITIKDSSTDPEIGLPKSVEYQIRNAKGGLVASFTDFDVRTKADTITTASGNAEDRTMHITFSESGTYKITAIATDEMGKTHTSNQFIYVSPAPQPPVAQIKGLAYNYANTDTVFTDASTDPNDDIVQWTWPNVLNDKNESVEWVEYFEEEMDENGDGTGVGEWRLAKANTDYVIKSMNDRTRQSGELSANIKVSSTLSFKNYGMYRIHLKVTDATGLEDETYHDINIIEDIPVPIPEVIPPDNQEQVTYTVTFINTDGTITNVTKVPAGSKLASTQVPNIVDLPDYAEHGWTMDGKKIEIPTEVVVNGNLTFVVIKTPLDNDPNIHTVTFINTDGTTTVIKVPDGSRIESQYVPDIINLPNLSENGWTEDGKELIDPVGVVVDRDMIFWVDTDPVSTITHDVIFINSDGTVTIVKVPHGECVPTDKVPDIIDLPDFTENGWTEDKENIVVPNTIPVMRDMVFQVDKDPIPENNHKVIFQNTDGEITILIIPDGEKIPEELIPVIKDLPDITENGWTENGEDIVDPKEVIVDRDLIFIVDTDPIPDEEPKPHKVTFINTDGEITTIEVPDGEKIPEDLIPDIKDLPGITENGWTDDGEEIVKPEDVVVDKDLIFWVDTTPEDNPNTHTVTFINTDGEVTIIVVPHGELVPADKVPDILDVKSLIENGWTQNGEDIVTPETVVVDRDLVFWVDTDEVVQPEPPENGAYIDEYDRLIIKQNRSTILDFSNSLNPPNDPIKWEQTDVEFITDDYSQDNIKLDKYSITPISITKPDGSIYSYDGFTGLGLDAKKRHAITFMGKEIGEFKIKVTLHNVYSDDLADQKPNSKKLAARTVTLTVIVMPDEPPTASLLVNNANPNFHNNPDKINVTVASSAISPDGDYLENYHWEIVRDEDDNGVYDEAPIVNQSSAKDPLNAINFDVSFKSGIIGKYLAKFSVQERNAQPTLTQYMNPEDYLSAYTEKEFTVNWTPCISYDFKLNNNAWAYVDDIITIPAIVKDENTATCKVTWTLKKKVGNDYKTVNPAEICDVWDFATLGGKIRITQDGYYILESTITDELGHSETFVSNEIRIYNLPVAVISDTPTYRWNGIWNYKQSRKFELDGNSSTKNDSTGEGLHEIDHNLDKWSITPLEGAGSVGDIYVLANDGVSRLESESAAYFGRTKDSFDEQIAIITPGTYMVKYQVTNSYGKKSAIAEQIITIVEDNEPIVDIGNPSSKEYLGSEEANRATVIGLTNVSIKSDDKDIVATNDNYVAQYRYDSNNDGDYEDEEWQDCDIAIDESGTNQTTKNKIKMSITATVDCVGFYQFRLQIKEGFGQPTLDTIIPEECYKTAEFFHEVEVDNVRPQGTFDVSNTVYGDIVFAMGTSDDVKEVAGKTMNFENSFGEVEGADVFKLDVQTVETSSINLADGIAWNTTQMSPRIGSVTTSNGGLTVNMTGNRSNAGQNIMYTTDYQGKIRFAFDYNLSFGDSFNGAGVVVNLADEGSTIRASIIWIPNRSLGMGAAGIYDVVYTKNSNGDTTPSYYSKIQSLSLKQSGRLDIEVNAGSITVTGSGVNDNLYTVTTTYNGDGFGFYSSHYSHGCSQIGLFAMTDIELEVTQQQSLADSLTDVSFNAEHDAFVIWTEDTIPQELDKTSPTYKQDYAELLSTLVSSNVHLIVLGSDENKNEIEQLLSQCLVPGIFIDTGTVDGDLQAARDFIASCLRRASDTNVKWILVNEESVYNKYYSDFNGHDHWFAGGTDTEGNGIDTILSSKWWYKHEPEYFLNNLGLLEGDQTWRPNEITMFDKTGHYFVDYKVKDNAVPDAWLNDNSNANPFDQYRYWSNNYGNDEYTAEGELSNAYAEIFVHRRPIAEFEAHPHLTATSELTGVDVINKAYDLDHYEAGNPLSHKTKGLQMYEWTWQLAEDPTSKVTATFIDADEAENWINDQLAHVVYNSNTDIILSYRVRDIDGVEVQEKATYTYQMKGNIYKAPENSYHHTSLDSDLIVNGRTVAHKGDFVTTSYDEAISELRAEADRLKALYENATIEYENKKETAKIKTELAQESEKAANNAEGERDGKQTQVDTQTTAVNNKTDELNNLKNQLTTALNELNAAKSNTTSAKTEYDTANAAYQTLANEVVSLNNDITLMEQQLSVLTNELNVLKAQDTSAMTPEQLTAHNNAIANKQTEVDTKQAAINDKKLVLTTKTSERDEEKIEVDNLYNKWQAAISIQNNKQTAYNNINKSVAEAEAELAHQQDVLNNLKNELETLKEKATLARQKATQDRTQADIAQTAENNARIAMNQAKTRWDNAENEIKKVKPIATNAAAWVTKEDLLTIPNGVWSQYVTTHVSGNPLPPVAKFQPNKIYYDMETDIIIDDQSYSPNGNNIVKWEWQITGGPNNIDEQQKYNIGTAIAGFSKITDDKAMEEAFSQYLTDLIHKQPLGLDDKENTYKITLIVTDDKSVPLTSKPYSVSIVIRPENKPPTIDPNPNPQPTPNPDPDKNYSVYQNAGAMIYEYDPYDANQYNKFFGDGKQKRGTEVLDWTVILDDPDNHDSYGTANDSEKYILDYLLERFTHVAINTVTEDLTTNDTKSYGPLTLTAADALVNSKVAPFTTAKDSGIDWGAYRITTSVTDVPNNGSLAKTTSMTTNPDAAPKHLYVIPKLEISDIHYYWTGNDEEDTTEAIPVGDTITVTFVTNAETVGGKVLMRDDEGNIITTNAEYVSTNPDGTKNFKAEPTIPDELTEDDLVDGSKYTFTVQGWTDYGFGDGTVTRTKEADVTINVLAIKLFNFHITDVTDPLVKFDKTTPVYVKDLAYDKSDSPNNTTMKKGYSFYFELSSMGLKNDADKVRIRPSFWGYNTSSGKYDIPLDVYYKNANNAYTLATYDYTTPTTAEDTLVLYAKGHSGSELGTIRELMLDKDDKTLAGAEQHWSGRYGLPSSTMFVKKGVTLTEENAYKGDVLISFDIEAIKNGVPKYNYIGRGTWFQERTTDGSTLANPGKAIYENGSVIVMDGIHSAIDNYRALPVWRQTNQPTQQKAETTLSGLCLLILST